MIIHNNGDSLPKLMTSLDCAHAFRTIWKKDTIDDYESVYAIYLDSKRQYVFHSRLNTSNYRSTCFNFRKALRHALNKRSHFIVIAHNHTSGNKSPSSSDIEATKEFIAICTALEIGLVDHIILTVDDYYSFSDNGMLSFRDVG
jgi:DNA repair protein RadC